MKRLLFMVFVFCSMAAHEALQTLKILHITFHQGCKNDFEDVANELGLDLTTWYVQSLAPGFWEGFNAGNEIYNVSHSRAERIWNRHKDFFKRFDVILTSDTAPLSRIFLQNGWQKPLIVWVCNRFDYRHGMGGPEGFPDQEYYALIQKAATLKNVHIISYTPYEYEYARRKGIDIGTQTIKPLGKNEEAYNGKGAVPENIRKDQTFFVFPRLARTHIQHVIQECAQRGMPAWSGIYNGPEELKQFKAVLFFPYAFSNLALFEDLQRGIIHFVPTQRFLGELGFIRGGMHGNLDWCEWYFDIYKDYLVFFDSWQELAQKAATLDYTQMKEKIKIFGQRHRKHMLAKWQQLFSTITNANNS